MLKNYAIFPTENINITQDYYGFAHARQTNSTNGIKSYPLDISYKDLYLIAPCDVSVVKMNGFYNESVLNQIFIWSNEKVYLANGEYDYITLLVGHINDWDFSSELIGKSFKRGEKIVKQGYDGTYQNNSHLDIVVAKGRQNTWVKNSYNEWVLPNSLKFEDVFYLDDKYNNIINLKGINFKKIPLDAYTTLPKAVTRDTNKKQLEVLVTDLRVRVDHYLESEIIGYIDEGIYNVLDSYIDDNYIWYEVEKNKWIATTDEWIKLYEIDTRLEESVNIFEKFFRFINNLINKLLKRNNKNE